MCNIGISVETLSMTARGQGVLVVKRKRHTLALSSLQGTHLPDGLPVFTILVSDAKLGLRGQRCVHGGFTQRLSVSAK